MDIKDTILGTILMLFIGHLMEDFILQNGRFAVAKCSGNDVTPP